MRHGANMANGKNYVRSGERQLCHNSSDFVGDVMTFEQGITIYQTASIALEVLTEAPRELSGHSVQMTSFRGYNV
jgi:hypothetical protein